ncbi:hypothetical protein [Sphingomonas sp.]|uniref:hypothetical protein n=1 Tax=Sphingomonas sp. TaxID=28214 RepID=UPI0028AAE1A2|nr:hypothetical protein [Sphingomonas sp.]
MAGKKEKKAKKDGKKTSFLPKVIDGIKLPKDARRQLTGLAKHPVIADLLASGLVALAQRIKGDGGKPEAPPTPAPQATPAPAATEPTATPAKPGVKRVRKSAATSAAPTDEPPADTPAPVRRTRKVAAARTAAEPTNADAGEAVAATPAKAPPPRRTRKKTDAATKLRGRRTPPKTKG